uniref:Uncharacterized protein n=1 Tax=Populus trichocarpa TaxID=3694 RepID=A0A2K1ZQ71_POPTR
MASGAEDDATVEAGDGCVLVQDSEKSCLFGMLSKAPDASCLWLTVLAGLKRSCRTVGENLVERTRLWFSCCSGDRGKMCFGFENGDGKGRKNGDGELTERGAAAFWRRDGDVKGRGDCVWPERDPSFPPREGLLRCFYF